MNARTRIASALVLGLLWIGLAQAPATAVSCAGYTGGPGTVDFNAFAGHTLRMTYRWCNYHPIGFVGPYRIGLRGVYGIRVTFPTRVPTGLGETLNLVQAPYLYGVSRSTDGASTWRFRLAVEQGHVALPMTSSYDFELQVRGVTRPIARICFVGRSCSGWQ